MRVLLDENLPVELARELATHSVDTVVGLGWSGVTNGELLQRAGGRYDAFLTMDRNLERQQSITSLAFGIILVRARSNRMRDLRPLVPELSRALDGVRAGVLVRVGA